jgi:hypothetical protein
MVNTISGINVSLERILAYDRRHKLVAEAIRMRFTQADAKICVGERIFSILLRKEGAFRNRVRNDKPVMYPSILKRSPGPTARIFELGTLGHHIY